MRCTFYNFSCCGYEDPSRRVSHQEEAFVSVRLKCRKQNCDADGTSVHVQFCKCVACCVHMYRWKQWCSWFFWPTRKWMCIEPNTCGPKLHAYIQCKLPRMNILLLCFRATCRTTQLIVITTDKKHQRKWMTRMAKNEWHVQTLVFVYEIWIIIELRNTENGVLPLRINANPRHKYLAALQQSSTCITLKIYVLRKWKRVVFVQTCKVEEFQWVARLLGATVFWVWLPLLNSPHSFFGEFSCLSSAGVSSVFRWRWHFSLIHFPSTHTQAGQLWPLCSCHTHVLIQPFSCKARVREKHIMLLLGESHPNTLCNLRYASTQQKVRVSFFCFLTS